MAKEIATKLGKLVLGNAKEVLKSVEDETFDAVITDPPYGITDRDYDDGSVFFELEDELFRVMKKDSWLAFFYSTKKLPEAFRLRKFKYVWTIPAIGLNMQSKNAFGDQTAQLILVFAKGKPKVKMRKSDAIISKGELPMVKPIAKDPMRKSTQVVAEIVSMLTSRGEAVLDPFIGYGTTGVVCEIMQRKWMGIEIDEKKFELAEKWLKSFYI